MAGSEGRTGLTGTQMADASFDTLGQANNALNRRVDALEREVTASPSGGGITSIQSANPFIINQTPVDGGIQVTCAINFPPASSIEWIKVIYRKTSQTAAKNKEEDFVDISAADAAAGHTEKTFLVPLQPLETYGLAALVAKGSFTGAQKIRNPDPPDDVNFLTTWTTVSQFVNDPSKPEIGLIKENKFDDVTKAFDAFIVARVYAPINGLLTAFTGTVSINGTTTITGNQTFVGQVVIGMLVLVGPLGQTRRVTAVAGNLLTVDLAMTGSGSTLQLLFGTPYNWKDALVRQVNSKFNLTDDPSATPINQGHVITDDEQLQTFIDYRISGFVAARRYNWASNVLIGEAGRRHVLAASTQTFIAGNFTTPSAGIPELTSVAYVYDTKPPYNDNLRGVSVVATQPNPPVALDRSEFRRFDQGTGTVQINTGLLLGTGTLFTQEVNVGDLIIVGAQTVTVLLINSDVNITLVAGTNTGAGLSYYISHGIRAERNLRRQKYTPQTGGQITIPVGDIKTKKLLTHIFRLTIFAQTGVSRDVDSNFTAGNVGDVQDDTAAPTLATNPVTGTTGPTVREKLSTVHYVCVIPSAHINTLDNYQAILSTSNTAPAGDPTVGSAGVLAITYGQHGHFDIALTASLTTDFYIYFRAHNEYNGGTWSVWSVGTNQHGYSNPVQSVIGSGVPVWAQRLDRANTGANVTNTTTKYYLDAGATATTDFYKGSGTGPTALQSEIQIPSLAAADRVRQITGSGQDGTGIFVTVSPAWSAAPAGNIAFEIHRGLVIGGKSGTGHGTTSFILDHGADSNVSITSHDYDGMSLYIPSATAGQEVQKITNSIYNGGTGLMTLTIEPAAGWTALGGAPANNSAYMICAGGLGYSGSDLTGTIEPVPFRTWRDDSDASNTQIVVEFLLPIGENAFDLSVIQIQVIKHTSEVLRYDDKFAPATTTSYRYFAFSSKVGSIRARIRNLNRDTGAKGWSDWTVYGIGNKATDTPTGYTPATYVPVDIDYLGPDSYPSSRYNAY